MDFNHINEFEGFLFACSLFPGCLAALILRNSQAEIFHDPLKNTTLIEERPYHRIRHPMYTFVLLYCASIINFNNSILLICYLLLFITFVIKSFFEERMIERKFTYYAEYKK